MLRIVTTVMMNTRAALTKVAFYDPILSIVKPIETAPITSPNPKAIKAMSSY